MKYKVVSALMFLLMLAFVLLSIFTVVDTVLVSS